MKALRQGAGWQAARQEFGAPRTYTQLKPVTDGLKVTKSTAMPTIDLPLVAQLRFEAKNRRVAAAPASFITPAQRAGMLALAGK
jgi:hypothetical protein